MKQLREMKNFLKLSGSLSRYLQFVEKRIILFIKEMMSYFLSKKSLMLKNFKYPLWGCQLFIYLLIEIIIKNYKNVYRSKNKWHKVFNLSSNPSKIRLTKFFRKIMEINLK